MKIISGSANRKLAKAVANELDEELSFSSTKRFSDGELNVEVGNDLLGQNVFIVVSTAKPVNDNLMDLLLLADAAKRVGANKIIAVIPYYGYARQDRVIKNGNLCSSISAKVVADLMNTVGMNGVILVDLHSVQLEGFFNIPITHLSCLDLFANHTINVSSIDKHKVVVVAPDVGALNRARNFAKILCAKYNMDKEIAVAVIDKHREKAGVSEVMNVIGEVQDKHCIIVDDIVDSGGTLCNAALALKNKGANLVVSCITHGVLSGEAKEKISRSVLDSLIITDSIDHGGSLKSIEQIVVLPMTNVLTEAIKDYLRFC